MNTVVKRLIDGARPEKTLRDSIMNGILSTHFDYTSEQITDAICTSVDGHIRNRLSPFTMSEDPKEAEIAEKIAYAILGRSK